MNKFVSEGLFDRLVVSFDLPDGNQMKLKSNEVTETMLMPDEMSDDKFAAPSYRPSERDRAITAARRILQLYAPDGDESVVARYLLRTLGVPEQTPPKS